MFLNQGTGISVIRQIEVTPKKTGKGIATVLGPKGTHSTPEYRIMEKRSLSFKSSAKRFRCFISDSLISRRPQECV
jgi:hypothetical protein